MPSIGFQESISANLTYWQNKVDEMEDPALRDLKPEAQNIYRAVEFGLALPETWRAAAELALALHYFIEHGGIWRSWQMPLQNALRLCREEDVLLKLRLLDRLGGYYRRDRDWERSLDTHRQEELLARALDKRDRLAIAQSNLGSLYWRQRQYEKAAEFAQQALSGFQEVVATDRQMGGLLTLLGLIDYGRGNYPEAVNYHKEAVDNFRQTNFTVLLARSLVNLALAQEADGDIDAAFSTYRKARSILEETDYEFDKTRIELSLGTLLFNTKRFDAAEEAYLRAYSPYLKRSGLVYYQGLATNNLGNVYMEQGRLEEAEAILRESLALWERAKAPLQAANTTGTLGRVLAAQGQLLEAMACFDRAIGGAEAFADDGWAKVVLEEFQGEREKLLNRQRGAGQVDE